MTDYYRLNEPDASAEVFDDEVLAINLSNGHYHSLRGIGVTIWKQLTNGAGTTEICECLRARHPGVTADVEADVTAFVAALSAAGLVVKTESSPDQALSSADGLEDVPSDSPYAAPVFESHTDMQDLLMIDPIHDVDVRIGWPLRSDAQQIA